MARADEGGSKVNKVIFDGTEKSVLEIMCILPRTGRFIRSRGKAITIITTEGPSDVYLGDTVISDKGEIYVQRKGG